MGIVWRIRADPPGELGFRRGIFLRHLPRARHRHRDRDARRHHRHARLRPWPDDDPRRRDRDRHRLPAVRHRERQLRGRCPLLPRRRCLRLPDRQRRGQLGRPPRGQRRRRPRLPRLARRPDRRRGRDPDLAGGPAGTSPPWSGSESHDAGAPSANTPACASSASPPSAVRDHGGSGCQEAGPHLRRLAAHGHAGTHRCRGSRAHLRRPDRARRARPRLRLQLPLGDARRQRRDGHRPRRRRPLDQRHELVPPARAALRRVRLLAGGDPRLRRLPLALRPRLQHEPRPPQPRRRDPLRAARRRRPAHRLHALPDLPWPPPPPGLARGPAAPRGRRDPAQVPPPHLGPGRALLRRPLRQPRGSLQVDLDPGQPRRLLGLLLGRAGQGRRLRLPALLAARQRQLLAPPRPGGEQSSRSPRPTTASANWSRRPGVSTPSSTATP